MTKIFINYRRQDSEHAVDRLNKALSKHTSDPKNDIFVDIDSIPLSKRFPEYIEAKVGECDQFIAVIGNQWVSAEDPETGGRRLDDPKDFVRREIEAAIAANKPIVPVVLAPASMPKAVELPDSLKELAEMNAVVLHRTSFEHDVGQMVTKLPVPLKPKNSISAKRVDPAPNWTAPLSMLLIFLFGLIFAWQQGWF